MRFMSMWSIIITSVIIRARAMSCSFHYLAQQAWMTAQCSVVNGLADCSNTTSARPHEFLSTQVPTCWLCASLLALSPWHSGARRHTRFPYLAVYQKIPAHRSALWGLAHGLHSLSGHKER